MKLFYITFYLFTYILITLVFFTNRSYAEIVHLDDKSIVSANNVSDAGTNIKLVLSKVLSSNNDISCILSIKITDKRGFWLFDDSKYCKLYLNINNNTETLYLKTNDSKNWIEDDKIFCSETDINITSKIAKSIFLADNHVFSLDLFSNFYNRRIILSPPFNNEIVDEWHYVYKEVNRTSINNEDQRVATQSKAKPESGEGEKVGKQKTKSESKNKETITKLKTKSNIQKSVSLTNSSKKRIAKEHKVGSIIVLQYHKKVSIYKESDLNRVAFNVPSGTKAKIIDSIINTGKNANPNLFKVEVQQNNETHIGWVSALVIYD